MINELIQEFKHILEMLEEKRNVLQIQQSMLNEYINKNKKFAMEINQIHKAFGDNYKQYCQNSTEVVRIAVNEVATTLQNVNIAINNINDEIFKVNRKITELSKLSEIMR